jgi:hypothetical protein
MASRAPGRAPVQRAAAGGALVASMVWAAGWRASSTGCSTIGTTGANPGRRRRNARLPPAALAGNGRRARGRVVARGRRLTLAGSGGRPEGAGARPCGRPERRWTPSPAGGPPPRQTLSASGLPPSRPPAANPPPRLTSSPTPLVRPLPPPLQTGPKRRPSRCPAGVVRSRRRQRRWIPSPAPRPPLPRRAAPCPVPPAVAEPGPAASALASRTRPTFETVRLDTSSP